MNKYCPRGISDCDCGAEYCERKKPTGQRKGDMARTARTEALLAKVPAVVPAGPLVTDLRESLKLAVAANISP